MPVDRPRAAIRLVVVQRGRHGRAARYPREPAVAPPPALVTATPLTDLAPLLGWIVRVAVLSDIHANLVALDAVLAAVGSVDAIWHLGDVVGYGPDPDGVVERLAGLAPSASRATTTRRPSAATEIDWFNPDARAAMEWTRAADLAPRRPGLAGGPAGAPPDGDFSLVHGSPRDPIWEYVTSVPVARANLAVLETRYGLHGHTHLPMAWAERDGRVEAIAPGPAIATFQLDDRPGAAEPGQRRSAARRRSDRGLPRDRRRGAAWHLAPGCLRHRGRPGGDARRRAAATRWPNGSGSAL